MATLDFTLQFAVIDPGCCNAQFAVPKEVYDRWVSCKTGWHCPHCGSSRHFTGESFEAKVKRLEQERDAARRRTELEYRSKIAVKGHLTRTKKRIANGVCPCCQRSFENLHKHMKTQHPDFAQGES